MKKFVALFLAVTVCVSAFAFSGCNKKGKDIDETKTQVYVSNYDAGIGRTWIEAIGKAFEEDFASYSFEEGKEGVQVIIDHNRTDTGAVLQSGMSSSSNNVFFVEGVDYIAMSNGVAADVTDIMNKGAITGVDASGNFTREEEPISKKISSEFLSYLNRGTESEGKYFGFPYYRSISGFLYDVDLWNENYYYFAKDFGCPSEAVAAVTNAGGDAAAIDAAIDDYYDAVDSIKETAWVFVNDEGKDKDGEEFGLSAGPDGKYGTFDDGMPATFEEFYFLMDKMVGDNITPFIWTGKFAGYADRLTNAIWQAYDGRENLEVYYSLNGTVKDGLVKLSNGKVQKQNGQPVLESYTFDGGVDDGYEIQRLAGKYWALQFADKVATTPSWTAKECYTGATSHITAQSTYIGSVNSSDRNRIAILADGAWWQQESDQTFEIMATANEKYSKQNREFSLLMAPNPTIERTLYRYQNNVMNTVVNNGDSFCLVNGNLKEGTPAYEISMAFMSYMNNEKCLNLFTEKTNMSRGLNYEVNEETYEKLTPYGKNLIDFTEETDVVYPYSSNELFHNNYQYLSNTPVNWNWHFQYGQELEHYYPLTQLHDEANRKAGLNGDTYFESLITYYRDRVWPKLVK